MEDSGGEWEERDGGREKGRGRFFPSLAPQSEWLALRENTPGAGDPTEMEPLEEAQRATAPLREGRGLVPCHDVAGVTADLGKADGWRL